MSKLITKIQNRLKENKIKKTIILPEAEDERVLKAALRVLEDGIVNIILVGNNEKILEDLNNDNINEKDLDIQKYIEEGNLKIYDVEKEETLYNNLQKMKCILVYLCLEKDLQMGLYLVQFIQQKTH